MKHFFTLLGFVLCISGLSGQQLVSVLAEHKEGGTMQLHYTDSYTYDQDGNVEAVTTSFADGTFTRKTYTYVGGLRHLEIYQHLDEPTQEWINQSKIENTYDVNGKLFSQNSSYWTFGIWEASSQTAYIYDASDFLVRIEINRWENNMWQPDAKFEMTNNAQGSVTGSTYYDYDNGTWTEVMRDQNTYNADGLMETLISETKVNGTWTNSNKNVFSYNANDLQTENLIHYWDQNAWDARERFVTTYHADQTKDVQTWQYWHEGTQEWRDSSRLTYTYSVVLGTEENTLAASEIYPNPAQDVVHVSLEKPADVSIILFDLSGKAVKTTASSGMIHSVSLAGIPSGTYLLSMISGNQRQTGIVVVN